MRIRLSVLAICLLLLVAVNAQSEPLGVDPGEPDIIYIDSVVATSFTRGFVPVYFTNDENLAGLELTITHDSPDILVDSFSFIGGRLSGFSLKGTYNYANSISIFTFPLDPVEEGLIEPGTGLMGYLFFTFLPNISEQVVSIDTITLVLGERQFSTVFSDESANNFRPVFENGYLNIQPSTCCLGDRGNVDNSPDDVVDVDDLVYLVDYQFRGGNEPVCTDEANVDGSLDGLLDVEDVVFMVDYMFRGGPAPSSCP